MPVEKTPEDTINILVATDCHLGFNELDPERGDDSFNTFEEILQYAVEYNVDFILLGGDLFHDAKPSPSCMLKCTKLLKKYCFGDKPVEIEIFSNQHENFQQTLNGLVNYEDPNINISYPVFSIHGNHDDPIGKGTVSSLDILSNLGLVNYFGKWTDYTQITMSPILMKKGATNLALYGLSFLKDQRLARLFREGKVTVQKFESDEPVYNILTLHQNRVDRGHLNFIPEEVLPKFLDLIVWGHEHDCRIEPEYNATQDFDVSQPGSSVATSLAAGEALPKNCGLLEVYGKKADMNLLPLKTVRPFVFETLVLSEVETLDPLSVDAADQVQEYLKTKVHEALAKAEDLLTGHSNQKRLPLIRLCVHYETDNQQFNTIRFGQQFSDCVANPQEMILMKKERISFKKDQKGNINKEALGAVISEADTDEVTAEALLEEYYKDRPDNEQLKMLSVKCLGEAVISFTQKGHTEALSEVINCQKDFYLNELMKTEADNEEDIWEHIATLKAQFEETNGLANIKKVLQSASIKPAKTSRTVEDSDDGSDDDNIVIRVPDSPPTPPVRGRGRGRGSRGPRGGRGSTRGGTTLTNAASLNITHDSSTSVSSTPRSSSRASSSSSKNWLADIAQQRLASTNNSTADTTKRSSRKKATYID